MVNGVAVGFLAYGLFAANDASIKGLGAHLPVFEIIFFVALTNFLTIGFGKAKDEQWRHVFHMRRPKLVLLRTAIGVVGGLCTVYAFTTLPLAEAYALLFLMPAFTTLLSIVILGETVGWRRWSAVGLGLLGVILVVQPGFRELHLGHLAAIAGALCGSCVVIALRILGQTERRITMLATIYTAAVVVNGILMIPGFVTPYAPEIALILLAGIAGGLGQIALLAATKMAPVSRIAPTQYSQMVWAVVIGAVFFNEVPNALAFLGMAMVVLSGLITFFREEQLYGWSRRFVMMRNRPDEL